MGVDQLSPFKYGLRADLAVGVHPNINIGMFKIQNQNSKSSFTGSSIFLVLHIDQALISA